MVGGGPLSCPRCTQSDQIRKVSTVVREGTASRPSEYWTSGALPTPYGPVTTRTDLARQLTMPAPPRVSRSLGGEIGCGFGVVFILWLVVGSIFAVLRLIPLAVILDVLLLAGLVVWIVFAVRRHSEEKDMVAAQNKQWPAMERVWNDLYYCFRDDIVFCGDAPSRNAPSSEMLGLLIEEGNRRVL